MPKIITILNQKGGVGKTTLAVNFATISAISGQKTLLVDADSQRTASSFRAIRPDDKPQFQCVQILTNTLHKDLQAFDYNLCFIDAGGRDSDLARSAILAADNIIVPILPSNADVWSSETSIKLISEIRNIKDLKAGVILNQLVQHTQISSGIADIVDKFSKKYDLYVFRSPLISRVAYKEFFSFGLGLVELAEMDGKKYMKAAEEMANLYNEVIQWVAQK